MKSKQFVVLGLGEFGTSVVQTLSEYEQEVVAIDKNMDCVEGVAEYATKAIEGDITDLEFLSELGLEEFDVGIVAITENLEESILGVLNLKEIGIPYVIAKAKNQRFESVLAKIGADEVIRPEQEMGERLVRSLLRKNITDLVELDDKFSIVEIHAPMAWIGHTIMSLNLRQNYNINLMGKRNPETQKLELYIDPNYVVKLNDKFLMVAETKTIEKLDIEIS